jgi:hypothetical protein
MNRLLIILFFISSISFGQLGKYSFYREIGNVNQKGYYSIPLGPEVLGKCKADFCDFRVYEVSPNDTIEAPYIMNWNDDEFKNLEYSAKLIDKSYKKNCCSFITLKFEEPKEINEIHLDIVQNNFDKLVKIEGSQDNRDWKTIEENMRIVGFGFDDYKYAQIHFSPSTFRFFRITLDDSNSKPIEITGASTWFNKFLSGSFTKIENVQVIRSEKKEAAQNYRSAKGRTIAKDAVNQTELKIVLPKRICLHHLKIASKDSGDFYRFYTYTDAEKTSSGSGVFSSLDKGRYTIVPMEKVISSSLTLTINNKDDRPVENIVVEVYGQNAELYSKLDPEKNYLLAYSVPNDRKPQYDMEYFSTKLPQSIGAVSVGDEKNTKEIKPIEPLVKNQKWLWITLGGLILIIGAFAFSLMKKVNNT